MVTVLQVNIYGDQLRMSIFASGSSASNLVAASLAVIQDAGEQPRFSLEVPYERWTWIGFLVLWCDCFPCGRCMNTPELLGVKCSCASPAAIL